MIQKIGFYKTMKMIQKTVNSNKPIGRLQYHINIVGSSSSLSRCDFATKCSMSSELEFVQQS